MTSQNRRARHAERRALLRDQLEEQRPDLILRARAVGCRERLEVQPVQQLVNRSLQLDVLGPELVLRSGPVGGFADAGYAICLVPRPSSFVPDV